MGVGDRNGDFVTPNVVVGATILGLLMPYCTACMVLLWKNRGTPIIQARKPLLVLLGNVLEMICIFCFMLFLIIYDGTSLPCYFQRISAFVTTCSLCTMYVLRPVILLFQFEIEKKLAIYRGSQSINTGSAGRDVEALLSGPGGWYVRHRRFLKFRALIPYVGVPFLVYCIIIALLTARDPSCETSTSVLVVAIFVVIHVPIWAFLVAKLWKFDRDALWIKEELSWTILVAVIAVVIAIAAGRLTDPILVFVLECVTPTLLITLSNAIPLIKSSRQLHLEFEKDVNIRTLAELLALPEGYKSFLAYVTKEFASESVLFWRDATRFRDKYLHDLVGDKQCIADCKCLHDKYISDDAPLQVNISYDVRTRITATLAGLQVITPPMSPRVLAAMANATQPTPKGDGGFFSMQAARSHSVAMQPHGRGGSQGFLPPIDASLTGSQTPAEHSVAEERRAFPAEPNSASVKMDKDGHHTPSLTPVPSGDNVISTPATLNVPAGNSTQLPSPTHTTHHTTPSMSSSSLVPPSASQTPSPAIVNSESNSPDSAQQPASASALSSAGVSPRQSNLGSAQLFVPPLSPGGHGPPPAASSGAAQIGSMGIDSQTSVGSHSTGSNATTTSSGGSEKLAAASSSSLLSIAIPGTIPEDVVPLSPARHVVADLDPPAKTLSGRPSKETKRDSATRGRRTSRKNKDGNDKAESKKERNDSLIPAHDLAKAFDEAIQAVLQLMQDDTLSRYLQSDEYKAFKERLNEAEQPEQGSKGSKNSKEKKMTKGDKDSTGGGDDSKGEHSTSEKSSTRAKSAHRHINLDIVA